MLDAETARQAERETCFRCRMSFVLAAPPSDLTERLRCPDCGRSFWCAVFGQRQSGPRVPVTCGIERKS